MRKDVSREQSLEVIAKFAQNFPFSNLSSEDAQRFIKNPKKFCVLFAESLIGKNNDVLPLETSHLRLIGKTTISATKAGSGVDQDNKHPFNWVANNFDNWDAQTVSKDTEETTAYVYEQIQSGTYAQIFGSFNKDLDLLSIETHEQLKDFVENSPELLHPEGRATHFLFKNKKGKRFIALVVHFSGDDLGVSVGEFLDTFICSADGTYRFVVLATKTSDIKS